jgi:hypothetical protein
MTGETARVKHPISRGQTVFQKPVLSLVVLDFIVAYLLGFLRMIAMDIYSIPVTLSP